MSEIQALMGWTQLLKLDEITAERNLIAEQYALILEPLGFKRQKVDTNAYHNIQSLIFTVPEMISRDAVIEHLLTHNIESTLGTYCLSELLFIERNITIYKIIHFGLKAIRLHFLAMTA